MFYLMILFDLIGYFHAPAKQATQKVTIVKPVTYNNKYNKN